MASGTEHAGVVGYLVVVDVVDVDALRTLAHLLCDDRGVEIALQDVGGGAETGEGPSAVNSRQDIEPVLSGSLPSLLRHLGDRPHHAAGEAVGVGKEPGERLPCERRSPAGTEAAHRQDGAGGVAGEEVAYRQPVVGKQAGPGCRALLDDRGIVGPIRDQDSTSAPGRTSERPGLPPPCRAGSPADLPAWCRATVPSTRGAHNPLT
jgi:hypothetical protein